MDGDCIAPATLIIRLAVAKWQAGEAGVLTSSTDWSMGKSLTRFHTCGCQIK